MGLEPQTSSRLRSVAAAEAQSAAHIRTARWGLAYKFALPVVVLQAAVLVVWGAVVLRQVRRTQLNETIKTGMTVVRLVAAYGEVVLRERDAYQRRRAEAIARDGGEGGGAARPVPFDDHWLVRGGLLTRGQWSRLTGTPVGQPVARERVERAERNAALFSFLTRHNGSEGEVLSVGVVQRTQEQLNQPVRRTLVASAEPIDAGSLFTPGDWMGLGRDDQTLAQVSIAGGPAEPTLPVTVEQGTVSWDAAPGAAPRAPVTVLMFSTPIPPDDAERPLGEARVALRADVIQRMRGRVANTMLAAGGLAVALATALCFSVARRVTLPIRRLLADMEVFAAGEMDHRTTASSQDEIGLVAAEFNRMAARLEVALGREKEAARLETELTTARDIQTSLLPPRVPFVRGFDLAVCYRPAREVGGDYYDFLPIDGAHLGIIVADVSGKSIPGALVMSLMRATLRFFVPGNLSAVDTLRRTNAFIAQDIKRGMFVSAFYLILDVGERRALCASAGHNPLVVCRADGTVQTVSPGGIALGFDKGPIFNRTIKEASLPLASGDRVVIYTDGVVEAMNPRNEEYGEERFHAFVRDARDLPSRDFVGALLADLDAHQGAAEQHDDITLVTFRAE